MYTNEISIGGVRIPNRLVLGPMAGVTDRPFRTICHELGAGLVSMEMVSANAVKYGNKNGPRHDGARGKGSRCCSV